MRRGYALLAAVCLSWGTIPLVVRAVDVPAPALAFARVWIAALGLAVIVALRTESGPAGPAKPLGSRSPRLLSHRPGLCLATGVVLAVHWAAQFAAYQRAPAGTVILVIYLAPVGVAALAPATLGERHSGRTLAALAVAVGGFLLLAQPAVRAAGAGGLGLAALSAATFVALILMSKPLAAVYGGLRLTLIEMTTAGVALTPLAVTASWGTPRADWAWMVVLGLGHTALATSLYLHVLGRIPATHVAILGYLEPVGVLVCAWAFLSETPAAATLAGGALILVAGGLLVRQAAAAEVPVAAR